MEPTESENCGTCSFWEPPNGNGEGKFGTCLLITHRLSAWKNAPNAHIDVDTSPNESEPYVKMKTTDEFYCSEWQPFS